MSRHAIFKLQKTKDKKIWKKAEGGEKKLTYRGTKVS